MKEEEKKEMAANGTRGIYHPKEETSCTRKGIDAQAGCNGPS